MQTCNILFKGFCRLRFYFVTAQPFFSRVHTFVVGENVSKRLIRGIAKAGRGVAEYIATGERMQSKVSTNMFKTEETNILINGRE